MRAPLLGSLAPTLLALGAIVLWSSLATLGVALAHVPALLLTGLSLVIGSLIALPLSGGRPSQWRVPLRTLGLGVYGLFVYHLLLFLALRYAPPVQANLVNYLWPLLIVLLSPVVLPGVALRRHHVAAAVLGFAGAAVVILGNAPQTSGMAPTAQGQVALGYVLALMAALIWASYSLLTKRVAPFPTAAVGSFALVSGLLSLGCHVWLEPATTLSSHDLLLVGAMGLGPMGAAFYLWDKALKLGDARHIGVLAYLTPLLSTAMLTVVTGKPLTWNVMLATAMIMCAAWMGTRQK